MTTHPPFRTVLFIIAALCLAGCCGPVWAQEARSPEADARDLAAEVMRRAGGGGLGDWTRSILDRALERAGETARRTVPGSVSGAGPGSSGLSAAPLPAERHAGAVAGHGIALAGTGEVLIFTSLSVPAASWRQWAREAARTGTPLVLRGVGQGRGSGSPGSSPGQAGAGGLRETATKIGERLGGAQAGVAIDPRLFRLFGIERVPAVVVVPGGVPPCASRGCADDPPPSHDIVSGNIGLIAALEMIADEGSVGRDAARRYLERLGREP